MKRKNGMNFNMLNVKSIRIMNRFTQLLTKYCKSYANKIQNNKNM